MRFIRFVVTVLIIALVAYVVYYLLDLNKQYKNKPISSSTSTVEEKTPADKNEQEEITQKDEEIVQIIIPENDTEELSEEDIQRITTEADRIFEVNLSSNVTKSFNEEVGTELYGGFDNEPSGDKRTRALIQYAGSMISIMPFDNQSGDAINEQYHYGDNNNLVLYVARQGEDEIRRYYFSYGKIVKAYTESGDSIELSDEEAEIFVNRALNIYNKFIK